MAMNATGTGTELPSVDFEKESYDLGGGVVSNFAMGRLEPAQSCLRWILKKKVTILAEVGF
ncbi:hypothetical protein DLM78_07755 [Leptospira stimsonii]|uniref:Uncharacterized protein n=1 Tax=Leptospira stimsonii TaxID=2202203 RepID=A0A8B3CU63_9LEPT|nr:hypothetical protein DLM78_07755 [Leptospira stimsonii]